MRTPAGVVVAVETATIGRAAGGEGSATVQDGSAVRVRSPAPRRAGRLRRQGTWSRRIIVNLLAKNRPAPVTATPSAGDGTRTVENSMERRRESNAETSSRVSAYRNRSPGRAQTTQASQASSASASSRRRAIL